MQAVTIETSDVYVFTQLFNNLKSISHEKFTQKYNR